MLVLFLFFAAAQPNLTADDIMARVADNQNRSIELRTQYIYEQKILITTRHTNGKLARQETADYLITPSSNGIEKKLQALDGKYVNKGQTVDFHGEPAPKKDNLDGSIIESFRNDLLNDKTKDGIAADLFPFAAREQAQYEYELAGEQVVDGRKAYRIRFRPKDKNDVTWAGEALIDEQEYQPISVYTHLSRRVPMAIRTLLGTDLPGLGFSVRYRRLDKEVWFPVSFGTEFRLHVLFFLNRQITMSSESKGFRRTNVESTLQFTPPQ